MGNIVFVIIVGAAYAPAEIMLGSRRNWLSSRLRGLLFWSPFALSSIAGVALVAECFQFFGIHPLFAVMFTGENVGNAMRSAIAGALTSVASFLLTSSITGTIGRSIRSPSFGDFMLSTTLSKT